MKKILQSFVELFIFFLTIVIVWLIVKYQPYATYLYICFGVCIVVLHLYNSAFLELVVLLTSVFVGMFYIIMLPQQKNDILYRVIMFLETITLILWYFILSTIDKYIDKQMINVVEEEEKLTKECSILDAEINKKQEEIYNNLIKIQNYKSIEEFVNKLCAVTTVQQIREYIIKTFSKMFHNCVIKIYFSEQISDPLDNKLITSADKNIIYCANIMNLSSVVLPAGFYEIRDMLVKEGMRSFIYIRFWQEKSKEVLGYLIVYSREQISEDRFRLISLLSSYINIALANVKLFEYTKELAIVDSLTGLYVQKYFKELLAEEMKIMKHYNKPLSLAMFDIDNFKQINDTFGHNIGDEVLIRFANILRGRLRETDIIARYGGDEFTIIFPNTTGNNAKDICEEIRNLVVKEILVFPRISPYQQHEGLTRLKFFISCGIAEYSDKFATVEEYINYVDKLLYQAKKTGKNKVVAG